MNFFLYLKDHLFFFLFRLLFFVLLFLLFFAFKVPFDCFIAIFILCTFVDFFSFFYDYFRRRSFYKALYLQVSKLDQAYLVLEMISQPEFYEGKFLWQILYDINKSMRENVLGYERRMQSYQAYIEMWVHEVKIPLATLTLMVKNHPGKFDKKVTSELKRLEDYVDQVLYYARCENASEDYLIQEVDLAKVIKNVGLKNMNDLLESKIDYLVDPISFHVLTDSKWLEFILEQIINNSIKYKRDIPNSYIHITAFEEENGIVLSILDNGIGIKASDINQVFHKSFTGTNGRKVSKSTGMGLFIAKSMCEKLGHHISIESKDQEYTKVTILFSRNQYYDVLK